MKKLWIIFFCSLIYIFKNIYISNVLVINIHYHGGSQMAQEVKNPPAMQESQELQVWSLGQKDPLEEEMATHSSILAWKIPQIEEPGRLQSMGSQRVRHDLVTEHTHSNYFSRLLHASVVPCPVLTVASWPAHRFIKRHVRRPGIPISFRVVHSLMWSTQSKALA